MIQIQVPFTDLRVFGAGAEPRLVAPNWPTPIANEEFVRSFGVVRRRRRGGLKGWSAEDHYCEVGRAVGIFQQAGCTPIQQRLIAVMNRKYGRLFSDGVAMVKLELGFAINNPLPATPEHLVGTFLSLPTVLCAGMHSSIVPLARVGKPIATFYNYCSSVRKGVAYHHRLRGVVAEIPNVFLELSSLELAKFKLPRSAKPIRLGKSIKGLSLSHWYADTGGSKVSVTALVTDRIFRNEETYYFERGLRLSLSRLIAEYSNLRRVLQSIAKGDILPPTRSESSDNLQRYLHRTIRRIGRFEFHLSQLAGKDGVIADAARGAMEDLAPGVLDSLGFQIAKLAPRPSIERDVKSIVQKIFLKGDLHMGDEFNNFGQAAAFGSNPKVDSVTQNQTMVGGALTKELEKLQEYIRANAPSEERLKALESVQKASIEASRGQDGSVASHLKDAGAWVLSTVKELGLPLLGELLKAYINS